MPGLAVSPRMRSPLLCLTFSLLLCSVTAFIPSFVNWGSCNHPDTMIGFEPHKYQGWWWDIERVPNEYQDAEYCMNTNISLIDGILVSNLTGLSADGTRSGKVALMDADTDRDPPRAGYMKLNAPGVPLVPYQVVATDYIQYSCVYSCLQMPGAFAEFFWIFGREPTMPEKVRQYCRKRFEAAGIDISKLEPVPQLKKECPYYPYVDERIAMNKKIISTYFSEDEIHTTTREFQSTTVEDNNVEQDEGNSMTSENLQSDPLTTVSSSQKSGNTAFLTDAETPASSAMSITPQNVLLATIILALYQAKSLLVN